MHAAWGDASCAPFFALGFGPSPETGVNPHAMPRVILRGREKVVLEWLISNGRRYAAVDSSEMIRRPLRSNWPSSCLCGTAVPSNVLSACMKVFTLRGQIPQRAHCFGWLLVFLLSAGGVWAWFVGATRWSIAAVTLGRARPFLLLSYFAEGFASFLRHPSPNPPEDVIA